jgi:hypothetical protein
LKNKNAIRAIIFNFMIIIQINMKKTLLYPVAAFMFLAASCKETLAPIGIKTNDNNSSDTSYYEAPDTVIAQQRRIYIEELTGAQCPNCPAGAEELHKLSTTTYPGELSIIAFHTAITGNFCVPITGVSKQDFRSDDGKRIFTDVWAISEGKPAAIFDRIHFLLAAIQTGYTMTGKEDGMLQL